MLVYCWRNLENDKEYIGSDTKDGEREKRHLRCVADNCSDCGGGSLLHKAIRKYGLENFEYSILEAGFDSLKSLRDAEYEAIRERGSMFPSGYNQRGDDGIAFGSGPTSGHEQILDYLPPEREIETEGTQIIKLRASSRVTPEWAKSNKKIQEMLLRSFPTLRTNLNQRVRAGRWARIIYLYYRVHLSESQIEEETGFTHNTVKMLIRSVSRAAKGFKASSGRYSGKPTGRPRKNSGVVQTSSGTTPKELK